MRTGINRIRKYWPLIGGDGMRETKETSVLYQVVVTNRGVHLTYETPVSACCVFQIGNKETDLCDLTRS